MFEDGKWAALNKGWRFLVNNRKALRRYAVISAAILLPIGTWLYLRPETWAYYTDDIEVSRIRRNVTPQYVMWQDAVDVDADLKAGLGEPSASPDGSVMVFSRGEDRGNSDLFFSRWDGKTWLPPMGGA